MAQEVSNQASQEPRHPTSNVSNLDQGSDILVPRRNTRGIQKSWFVGSSCLCGLLGDYSGPSGTHGLAESDSTHSHRGLNILTCLSDVCCVKRSRCQTFLSQPPRELFADLWTCMHAMSASKHELLTATFLAQRDQD